MAKQIISGEIARRALRAGVDTVADAVKITIGPRGRNVVMDKGYGAPMITNDGVSIAKEITLPNKMENMGAEIVKEVASRTDEIAQVTTSSFEADEMGKKIAETIKKVGKDGVGTVEESQSFGIDAEIVEGMEFDKGYVSPYMI